ncbi:MAG: putative TetR family transcriptional regulator [Acidimicrobiales bacterium]|jgi:AcrR family transcriptional regulator|nr:putative TetR family transcriptional regulator [Acidimicrobiales bacterium]
MVARLPAVRRRRQLLDVALDVFAERGFYGVSMSELAEAAGVTKPVLYQHFGSKRDLYLELLDDVGDRLMDEITKATASAGGPRQQVEAGFAAYFRFVTNQPAAFRLLFGGTGRSPKPDGTRLRGADSSEGDRDFAAAVRKVEDAIAEAIAVLIDADIDEDHRRLLAHGLVGLAEGTSRHWVRTAEGGDPDLLGRRLADLAWAGLRSVHR